MSLPTELEHVCDESRLMVLNVMKEVSGREGEPCSLEAIYLWTGNRYGGNPDERHQRTIRHCLSEGAADPKVPIVRVGSPNSGVYRYVPVEEDLVKAKREQPRRRNRHETVETPDICTTGDCLRVLVVKGDSVLVQVDGGSVFRAVLEPVIV